MYKTIVLECQTSEEHFSCVNCLVFRVCALSKTEACEVEAVRVS